ncbi:hypothetical protein KM043_009145 [Ampulex compressa]|nr:hypothetical protein KM043_009145 [Ampulex compressa]
MPNVIVRENSSERRITTKLHDGRLKNAASGALFGGFTALRHGMRGRELINNVGKVMIQGGGTFGTFMAIGTGIRC